MDACSLNFSLLEIFKDSLLSIVQLSRSSSLSSDSLFNLSYPLSLCQDVFYIFFKFFHFIFNLFRCKDLNDFLNRII